jgi:hypothetical protein
MRPPAVKKGAPRVAAGVRDLGGERGERKEGKRERERRKGGREGTRCVVIL